MTKDFSICLLEYPGEDNGLLIDLIDDRIMEIAKLVCDPRYKGKGQVEIRLSLSSDDWVTVRVESSVKATEPSRITTTGAITIGEADARQLEL